jgi:hypothetical protein
MTLNDRFGDHGRIFIRAYVAAQLTRGTMERALSLETWLMPLAQR